MSLTISVVIPAYNAAAFVADAIGSARAQLSDRDEIIVVDDGSTDGTSDTVAALGPGVVCARQANAGVSAARNLGIALSSGDIVAFLDADDRWLPGKVRTQLEVFARDPSVGLVATDRCDVDGEGRELHGSLFRRQGLYDELAQLNGQPVKNALARLVQINFLPTSSVMVSRRALDAVGLFDTSIRYGEDLDLWARVASQFGVVCLPQVLVSYRRHDSNATHQTERLLEDMVKVMRKIRVWGRTQLQEQGLDPDELVARAEWELGYWQLNAGRPGKARKPFWASFKESPDARRLAFALLSCFPPRAVDAVRGLRRRAD